MTYRCDACHAFIGRPWHCNECDDFDLCNGCYVAWSCEDANAAIHNPSHHFTKVSAVRDGKTEANDVKEANDVAATVISALEERLSFSLTSLSVDTDASIEPIQVLLCTQKRVLGRQTDCAMLRKRESPDECADFAACKCG